MNSRRLGEPMSPVSARPLLMAIRMRIGASGCSAFGARQLALHRERGADGAGRVVGLLERRAEHREDRVADELVERAVVLEDHLAHPRRRSR